MPPLDRHHRTPGLTWLEQIFDSKAAQSGGIVRRSARDVAANVGLARFELEVRRRGHHLVACDDQLIVNCSQAPLTVVC